MPEQKKRFTSRFKRKHNSTFTDSEKRLLSQKQKTCDPFTVIISPHFRDRRVDYAVKHPVSEFTDTIRNGTIVDYSVQRNNRSIERFLIRRSTGVVHIVAVAELDNGKWSLITGWENKPMDNHDSLDMSIYEDFDIR